MSDTSVWLVVGVPLAVGSVFAFGTILAALAFVARIPRIESEDHLDSFKTFAARNMYLALLILVLGVASALLTVGGILTGRFSLGQTILPLSVFGAVYILLGLVTKLFEKRVQTLPVSDSRLRAERDRVVGVWLTQPFPDW